MVRLTRAQVREVDRRAIQTYHVPGIVLMENAARAVSEVAREMLRRKTNPRVLIVCGGGNNGGDGLAVARHLHNPGIDVTLALATDPTRYGGDAAVNWRIAQAMDLPTTDDPARLNGANLIIDALFGTGLQAAPRDGTWIDAMNGAGSPILAVDLPSGLDCDTGEPLGACVRAARTVTFVAEKAGFANPHAKQFTGDVIVGDIGCPREIVDQVLRDMPTNA